MHNVNFSGRSSAAKDEELMNFLHERIFDPILNGDYEDDLKRGVRLTIMRMENLSTVQKVQYFWSAVVGTENSISFAGKMLDARVTRFEDVIDEFRVRFGDQWLRR